MSYAQQPDGVFETIEQIKKDQEETQKYLNEITDLGSNLSQEVTSLKTSLETSANKYNSNVDNKDSDLISILNDKIIQKETELVELQETTKELKKECTNSEFLSRLMTDKLHDAVTESQKYEAMQTQVKTVQIETTNAKKSAQQLNDLKQKLLNKLKPYSDKLNDKASLMKVRDIISEWQDEFEKFIKMRRGKKHTL